MNDIINGIVGKLRAESGGNYGQELGDLDEAIAIVTESLEPLVRTAEELAVEIEAIPIKGFGGAGVQDRSPISLRQHAAALVRSRFVVPAPLTVPSMIKCSMCNGRGECGTMNLDGCLPLCLECGGVGSVAAINAQAPVGDGWTYLPGELPSTADSVLLTIELAGTARTSRHITTVVSGGIIGIINRSRLRRSHGNPDWHRRLGRGRDEC